MAAVLDPEEHVHRVKLGAQILYLALMLALELFQNRFELSLGSLDVLANYGGPLAQVAANIAHRLIPHWLILLNHLMGQLVPGRLG